jgi:hypothetical protein
VQLDQYVAELQRHLATAADSSGDEARAVAERLGAPLEAATRLVLLEALSAAAGEITRELSPGSVDVRLRGLDPEFVVTSPPIDETTDAPVDRPSDPQPPVVPSGSGGPPVADGDEGAMARITLRLPEPVKLQIEQAAGRSGVSVNSWLVMAAANALGPQEIDRRSSSGSRASSSGQRITGWAR